MFALSVARADDFGSQVLRIPGLPPLTMPPGVHPFGAEQMPGRGSARPQDDSIYHEFGTVQPGGGARRRAQDYGQSVIGPGGVVRPPRPAPPAKPVETAGQRQARIRKALAPKPPLAVLRQNTLNELYAKLAAAKDGDEAKGIASLIMAVWMRSGSDTANLLMARAEGAIAAKNYPSATAVLDKLVELQPNWAEAWNKRATVRFLTGDLNGAMADVDRVLKLEPKHFAALNGLAIILQQTGFDKRALQVYRRELAIYPHQADIERIVDKLSLEVEGQGI